MSPINYPGDCTDFDPDAVMGPDHFGGHWLPTSATYDPETDTTRMMLRPITPAELEERKAAFLAKLNDHRASLRAFLPAGPS